MRELSSERSSDSLRFALFNWKVDKPAYDEWATLVESAISYEVGLISQRRSNFQELGEDALTAIVSIALESLGLKASSSVVNGNCDLTVSYDNYLWLGEAKIFTGVTHVWGGYLQLTTRYATGLPGHNRGGMLLYCFKENAKVLLQEWRGTLEAQIPTSNPQESELPLAFLSSDTQSATGIDLKLVHFAFPLYHAPQEDILKLTPEALKAGRDAKKAARKAGLGEDPGES